MEFSLNKQTILAIAGVSGSGKSSLEANLLKEYPELFYKVQQFASRKMREGEKQGNPYIFVNDKTFDFFEDKLIGVIGTKPDSLFKSKYGSLPDFQKDKISTIILAEEGIIDLKNKLNTTYKDQEYQVFVLGLDISYETISKEEQDKRVDRDLEFVNKEREVLKLADVTIINSNINFADTDTVMEILVSNKILKKRNWTDFKQIL